MTSDPTAPPVPQDGRSPDAAGIATVLVQLGCPADKAGEMASQLLKRASQLAAERGWPVAHATAHLLRLFAGGWAAQARGFPSPAS